MLRVLIHAAAALSATESDPQCLIVSYRFFTLLGCYSTHENEGPGDAY